MSLLLYGIARADAVAAPELRAIRAGGIAAFVSDAAGATGHDLARLHDFDARVRSLWTAVRTFLPARYGQTFPDEGAARRWLDEEAPRLGSRLELVRDAAQMTVRLRGPAAPAAPVPDDAGPGTAYLLRRARRRALPEAAPLSDALRGRVRAERTVRGGPGLLGTVYHLVDRDRLDDYRERCRGVEASLVREGRAMTLTGPWPPYAFASEEA